MADEVTTTENTLTLDTAGLMLRRAREERNMSIEQVAAETRITQRHLALIEEGDFEKLPGRTYAIGFSRTYAKAVGLDDREIADRVRAEMAENGLDDNGTSASYDSGDPARIPARGLAWLSALAAILLIAGGFAYFRDYFIPGSGPGPIVAEAPAPSEDRRQVAAATQPVGESAGPVVFTALEDGIWVKFYDAQGTRLMEKQMALNESFTVPEDVAAPQIWTARPEALGITVGGKAVPKLAEELQTMRDVEVSAEALLARANQSDPPQAATDPTSDT